jgi:PhnB protein
MPQNPPEGYSRITPYLLYEDAAAAIAFLTGAFGFTERLRMADASGAVLHAELVFEGEALMLGAPGGGFRSARSSGLEPPVFTYLYVDDVDAHFARAKAAGAEITSEPEDQPYGDRSYRAKDPEGLVWHFAQSVRDLTPEDLEALGATAPDSSSG